MEQTLSLGCLVMAAGSGRRFGGNKLAAELDGKTLIRRALEAVPGARFSAVTVVSQYEDIEELAGQFGFAAIHNDRPDLGLSHTIRLGTEAMRGCDGILYMVADQPKLRQETVARIVEVFCQHPDRIVGAGHEGRRGNPNLFPARFFEELMALSGDHGGSSVIRTHEDALLLVETDAEELFDCDTPEALESLT